MTVAALPSKKDYVENGVTLSFPIPFRFLAGAITVTRLLIDGTVVPLASGTDFSVTGGSTDTGGTLTLISSVAGARLRIKRVTPRSQSADYAPNDAFPAKSHEGVVDRAMMIDQEQDDKIADTASRALMVPDGETVATIPSISDRSGKLGAYDANGRPIAIGSVAPAFGIDQAALRSVLADRGQLQSVIDNLPSDPTGAVRIRWDTAARLVLGDPLSAYIAATLGLNDSQMAELVAASKASAAFQVDYSVSLDPATLASLMTQFASQLGSTLIGSAGGGDLGWIKTDAQGRVFIGPRSTVDPSMGGVFPGAYSESGAALAVKADNIHHIYSLVGLADSAGHQTTIVDSGPIAVMGYAFNTNATYSQGIWSAYYEARRSAGAGPTFGVEIAVLSAATEGDVTPADPFGGYGTIGESMLAGRVDVAGMSSNPAAAYRIAGNGRAFRRGIVFAYNALDVALGEAVAMYGGQGFAWYDVAGSRSFMNSQVRNCIVPSDIDGFEGATVRTSLAGGDAPTAFGGIIHRETHQVRSGGVNATRVQTGSLIRNGTSAGWFVNAMNDAGAMVGITLHNGGNNCFSPNVDNVLDCGSASARWANIRAGNGSIITTSDGRLKKDLGSPDPRFLAAIRTVQVKHYQMLDAIADKGEAAARIHTGIIAQDLVAALQSEGLDWRRYGVICEDPLMEVVELTEEREVPVTEDVGVQVIRHEIVDGKAVQHIETISEPQPVIDWLDVVDEDGALVVQQAARPERTIIDQAGKPVTVPASDTVYAKYPVTRTRREIVTVGTSQRQVEIDGVPQTTLSVRYDQLALAMIAAIRSV